MSRNIVLGQDFYLPFSINQTDLLAGTSAELVAPVDGYIDEILVVVQTAVTVGGDITVAVGTTAINGLSATIASAATKGTVVTDLATEDHPTRKVSKGGRIQVIPSAAFDTAGAVSGYLKLNTAH